MLEIIHAYWQATSGFYIGLFTISIFTLVKYIYDWKRLEEQDIHISLVYKLPIYGIILFLVSIAASDFKQFKQNYSENSAQRISELENAAVSNISAESLRPIYATPSQYTDLQRKTNENEIKNQVIDWELEVYEIRKVEERKNVYLIDTLPGTESGSSILDSANKNKKNHNVKTLVYVTIRNSSEEAYLNSVKTNDWIRIKGIIKGVTTKNLLRFVEITPAIIIRNGPTDSQGTGNALPKIEGSKSVVATVADTASTPHTQTALPQSLGADLSASLSLENAEKTNSFVKNAKESMRYIRSQNSNSYFIQFGAFNTARECFDYQNDFLRDLETLYVRSDSPKFLRVAILTKEKKPAVAVLFGPFDSIEDAKGEISGDGPPPPKHWVRSTQSIKDVLIDLP
jgi:hypothetical protein